ncbi:OprD family porin [Azomonas macrocytogenes]|nr:OprD family porin [Azomonas macrocytogenes]
MLAAMLAILGAQPATAAGFIEDSKATLSLRNFYFNQDNRNGGGPRSEEWGQAFFLDYKSGFTEGPVGFGLDVLAMHGIRLDGGGRSGKANAERTPGALFPLESNGKAKTDFGRVGVTGKLRFSKTEARLGTLLPKMPVLIYNDGRLLPQLFHGTQITSNEVKDLTLTAGKIEHSTERNSSDSYGLSIAGANSGSQARFSNKFYFAGADYKATKDLTLQYYFGNLKDFYKQHFVGLIHNWILPAGSLKTDLRYFDSDSDSKNASRSGRAEGYRSSGYWRAGDSRSGEVDNRLWSAMFTYDLSGHSLGIGYQKVTGNSDWPRINLGTGQTVYLITNLQNSKFASAGERSWVGRYAYDFAAVGVPGLATSLTYVSGRGIDATGSDNKEWERDFRLDYVVQGGPLKGLGFSWRNATLRGNDTTDRDENRLIVTYKLSIL